MAAPLVAPTIETIALQEKIESLISDVALLKTELGDMWTKLSLDIAHDRQRISKLEGVERPSIKAEDYIERIYAYLLTSKQQGMTYRQAAKILGISTRRIQQLKKRFENDQRFVIARHPRKTNSHVICIRKVVK